MGSAHFQLMGTQTEMTDDIAISVKNLTKKYRIFGHPGDRIKQALTFGRMRFHREFTALQDVSFEIKKGETVGIIGRNGSGKSTLLQLVCGILKPTSGKVEVNGRISALLELGAGFNPEFTGRENVYFQGAVIGLTKEEMDERFDDIAAFADIGEFIDQSVRTYSSGMYVRLAFAAAINVSPDILVVDEALAVGDVRFQSRCFRLFEEMKAQARTIVFVSHNAEQIVRLCDRALLLENGGLEAQGETKEVTNRYLDLALSKNGNAAHGPQRHLGRHPDRKINSGDSSVSAKFHLRKGYNPGEYRWGDRTAEILDFSLGGSLDGEIPRFRSGDKLVLSLLVAFYRDVEFPIYGLTLKSPDGIMLFGTNSRDINSCSPPIHSRKCGDVDRVNFSITLNLTEGDYFLSVGVAEDSGGEQTPLDRRYDAIHIFVTSTHRHGGFVDLAPTITVHSDSE